MTNQEASAIMPKRTSLLAKQLRVNGEKYWQKQTTEAISNAAKHGINKITMFVWTFQAKPLEKYLKTKGYSVKIEERKGFGKYLTISWEEN